MNNIVSQNLKKIRQEIAPHNPVIIAVTKYHGLQGILDAYEAGIRDFAESRVIEAINKINSLHEDIRKTSRFHLIGHLQTNKAKKAVAIFDLIHSVDSLRLAKVISDEAQAIGKIQKVLLQVNNANEAQKFGFSKEDLLLNFAELNQLPGIKIIGLMNMAPHQSTEIKHLFKEIAELNHNLNLPELSMGMSDDYVVAARAGATMLRIGSLIFTT